MPYLMMIHVGWINVWCPVDATISATDANISRCIANTTKTTTAGPVRQLMMHNSRLWWLYDTTIANDASRIDKIIARGAAAACRYCWTTIGRYCCNVIGTAAGGYLLLMVCCIGHLQRWNVMQVGCLRIVNLKDSKQIEHVKNNENSIGP